MNPSTFALLLTGVLLNAAAQLLLKAGVMPLGSLSLDPSHLCATLRRVVGQWPILAGLGCYVVSVGVWVVGLSRVDVSVAYPMLSLGYVVTALAAAALFGEALGAGRWMGMALILAGVAVMYRS